MTSCDIAGADAPKITVTDYKYQTGKSSSMVPSHGSQPGNFDSSTPGYAFRREEVSLGLIPRAWSLSNLDCFV